MFSAPEVHRRSRWLKATNGNIVLSSVNPHCSLSLLINTLLHALGFSRSLWPSSSTHRSIQTSDDVESKIKLIADREAMPYQAGWWLSIDQMAGNTCIVKNIIFESSLPRTKEFHHSPTQRESDRLWVGEVNTNNKLESANHLILRWYEGISSRFKCNYERTDPLLKDDPYAWAFQRMETKEIWSSGPVWEILRTSFKRDPNRDIWSSTRELMPNGTGDLQWKMMSQSFEKFSVPRQ